MNKLLITLLFSFFSFLSAKQVGQYMKLVHADSGHFDHQTGFSKHFGNVTFKYDSILMSADKVYYQKSDKKARFFGNVTIKNGQSNTVTARTGRYSQNDSLLILNGNVHSEDHLSRVSGDSIYFYQQNKVTEIFGNAMVYDKENKTTARGNWIQSIDNKFITIIGNGEFFEQKDSLKINGDTLVFDKYSNRSIAKSRVEINQRSVQTTADRALFLHADSIIRLNGDPVVFTDDTEVRGDSMVVYLTTGSLKTLDVLGNALVINLLDSVSGKRNKFEGQKIFIEFENKKIKFMKSLFNAISIVHFEGNKGANSVSADSIYIYFNKNQVDLINEYGGVEGAFYPEGYRGEIKNDY